MSLVELNWKGLVQALKRGLVYLVLTIVVNVITAMFGLSLNLQTMNLSQLGLVLIVGLVLGLAISGYLIKIVYEKIK